MHLVYLTITNSQESELTKTIYMSICIQMQQITLILRQYMIEAPLQTFHGAEISLEQKYHAYLTLN